MTVISEFLAEIASLARAHDHDILLVTADEGPAGLRRLVGRSLCDALILMEVGSQDDRIPVARAARAYRWSLIGVPDDRAGLHCVDFDFEAAGATCVDEMADLGHTEIALLAIDPASVKGQANFSVRFRRGVEAAAQRRRVNVRTLNMEPNHADARRVIDEMLLIDPAGDRVDPAALRLARPGHRCSSRARPGARHGHRGDRTVSRTRWPSASGCQ